MIWNDKNVGYGLVKVDYVECVMSFKRIISVLKESFVMSFKLYMIVL